MKKIFIATLMILISNTVLAEMKMIWSEKKSPKEFIDFYTDLSEVKSKDNILQIPFYYNHDGPDAHPFMSSGGIAEMNCKDKVGRTIYFVVFTEKNLTGEQLTEMKLPNEKWKKYGKTHKPFDALFNAVCSK
jgi:hypothetical protein